MLVFQFLHDRLISFHLILPGANALFLCCSEVSVNLYQLFFTLLSLNRGVYGILVEDLLHVDIVHHLGALGCLSVEGVVALKVKEGRTIYISLNIVGDVLSLLLEFTLGQRLPLIFNLL